MSLLAIATALACAVVQAGPIETTPIPTPTPPPTPTATGTATSIDRGSPWALGTSVAGGWDSNPLALTVPVASELGAARAWLGRELGESGAGYLQLRYDGTRYASLTDADLDRVEASAEQAWRAGALSLRVAGAGAIRLAGDPARSGWDAGGRAAARLRLGSRVALRAGAGYAWRQASDRIYSGGTGFVDLGLEISPWKGASAVARCSLASGTEWIAGTTSTGGGGYRGGTGTRGTGATGASLALQSLSEGASIDVQQGLGGGLFLHAGYGATLVRTGGTSRLEHVATGGLGWAR